MLCQKNLVFIIFFTFVSNVILSDNVNTQAMPVEDGITVRPKLVTDIVTELGVVAILTKKSIVFKIVDKEFPIFFFD